MALIGERQRRDMLSVPVENSTLKSGTANPEARRLQYRHLAQLGVCIGGLRWESGPQRNDKESPKGVQDFPRTQSAVSGGGG